MERMTTHVYQCVLEWIPERSRVLDLGTGDGEFLAKLAQEKNIYAEGVEKNKDKLVSCFEKGLTVYHGDILLGLDQFPDHAFDYVLLLGTFEQLIAPDQILKEAFRVGKQVVIGFTNFAYWRNRLAILLYGKSPQRSDEKWYEQLNIQFFSLKDFREFCQIQKNISLVKIKYFTRKGELFIFPNFRAFQAVCMLRSFHKS